MDLLADIASYQASPKLATVVAQSASGRELKDHNVKLASRERLKGNIERKDLSRKQHKGCRNFWEGEVAEVCRVAGW